MPGSPVRRMVCIFTRTFCACFYKTTPAHSSPVLSCSCPDSIQWISLSGRIFFLLGSTVGSVGTPVFSKRISTISKRTSYRGSIIPCPLEIPCKKPPYGGNIPLAIPRMWPEPLHLHFIWVLASTHTHTHTSHEAIQRYLIR